MSTSAERTKRKTELPWENIGELLERLGGIAPERIWGSPPPGKGTEADVLRLERRLGRLFELVDGALVEKIMGHTESFLAIELAWRVRTYLEDHQLGFLAGADGAARLMPGLVRYPDLSFFAWDDPAKPVRPTDPIARKAPTLAIEVLSPGNTRAEMERKLKEYFLGGSLLVWYVDPVKRIVTVYTAPDRSVKLTEEQTLDGGAVLPGFTLPLGKLFAGLSALPQEPTRPRKKRK